MKQFLRALCILLTFAGVAVASTPGPSGRIAPGGPDLKTTLEKGLRARRPVEFAFIAQVLSKVDDGTLPPALVKSTFLWARKKQPYPYPWFESALKTRAKRIGISL